MTEQPLARLFAIAFRSLVDELHVQLAARGWSEIRPAFGFVLLAVRDEPTTATELSELMGTSKQATSKLIDAMLLADLVQRVATTNRRQRPVEITDRGLRLLAAVELIYQEIEAEWAAILGPAKLRALRTSLTTVLVSANGGQMPAVRPGT